MDNKTPFFKLLTIAVFLITAYLMVSAVYTTSSTGVLIVKSSDPNATIAISKNGGQSQYLGLDNVKVRLYPGTYLVSASDQSNIVTSSVTVTKKQTVNTTLNINQLNKVSSQNNKMLEKLPVTGPASEYTINYVLNYNNEGQLYPVLVISSTSPAAQQAALAWFSYWKFNINNYHVEYKSLAPLPASYNYFQ